MTHRIESWVNERAGQRGKLWEATQHAKRREGVVVLPSDPATSLSSLPPSYSLLVGVGTDGLKRARERIHEKHEVQLQTIAETRDRLKMSLEEVAWRLRVVHLAIGRMEHSRSDECGWDQRLCFDSDEWQELGQSVVDSYDEGDDGEWWCLGRRKCDRHAG
jgi:COMPASS component SPP1